MNENSLFGPDIRTVISEPTTPPRRPPQWTDGRVVVPVDVAPVVRSSVAVASALSGNTTGVDVWQLTGSVRPRRLRLVSLMLSFEVPVIRSFPFSCGMIVPLTGSASTNSTPSVDGKPRIFSLAENGGHFVFASKAPGISPSPMNVQPVGKVDRLVLELLDLDEPGQLVVELDLESALGRTGRGRRRRRGGRHRGRRRRRSPPWSPSSAVVAVVAVVVRDAVVIGTDATTTFAGAVQAVWIGPMLASPFSL